MLKFTGHQLMDKRVLTQYIDQIQPHILHNLPKTTVLSNRWFIICTSIFCVHNFFFILIWNDTVIVLWQYRIQSSSLHNSFSHICSSQHSNECFCNVLKSLSHGFTIYQFTLQRNSSNNYNNSQHQQSSFNRWESLNYILKVPSLNFWLGNIFLD